MDKAGTSRLTASNLRAYIMIAVLAVIWVFFHWATDSTFLTARNLANLMTQMSVTGIIAVGMLMVIVSGNIDLSVGSVLGLAGGIAAYALTVADLGLPAAVIGAVVVGFAIGLFQGTLTAYLNIPAFIVTLGGLLAWRGVVKWLLGGNTIPNSNETFRAIGNANLPEAAGWALAAISVAAILFMAYRKAVSVKKYGLGEPDYLKGLLLAVISAAAVVVFIVVMNTERGNALVQESGVPIPVLILLAVALLGAFLTNSTVFGRHLYAIGGNPEAARLSGINNKRNILKVYALLGALTGIAALIFTSRVNSAAPDAGVLKELDAIAACVIGGASLMGGRGTIFGACLGALIMASLDNGMSLLTVRDFMQDIIKGSILVAAVGLDMMGRRTA
jgi:D-xylose transport system permease protein